MLRWLRRLAAYLGPVACVYAVLMIAMIIALAALDEVKGRSPSLSDRIGSMLTRPLNQRIAGTWYLRSYHITIRDGMIAFTQNGAVWAHYRIVDDTTMRVAFKQGTERLLTVRFTDDEQEMRWLAAGGSATVYHLKRTTAP